MWYQMMCGNSCFCVVVLLCCCVVVLGACPLVDGGEASADALELGWELWLSV